MPYNLKFQSKPESEFAICCDYPIMRDRIREYTYAGEKVLRIIDGRLIVKKHLVEIFKTYYMVECFLTY